jgi:chitin disaccharide deacetylase
MGSRFAGETVFVRGASRGIGLQIIHPCHARRALSPVRIPPTAPQARARAARVEPTQTTEAIGANLPLRVDDLLEHFLHARPVPSSAEHVPHVRGDSGDTRLCLDPGPEAEELAGYRLRTRIPLSARSAQGLLIVNADDWGGFRDGTNAIEACFAAGAISSATAMVHMADSRRAAEVALDRRRPIGLHLNLTQAFDSPEVPMPVRERQRRLCSHFANLKRRRWRLSSDPRIHRLVADAIRDQLEEFCLLYAREPTHFDSHHHVHVCPDVFLSKSLPAGSRVRQTLSSTPSFAGHELARLARRTTHSLLARRFVTTARFWRAGEPLSQGDGAVSIADARTYSLTDTVEVMVHPSFESEVEMLLSDSWLEVLGRAPLGPYTSLSG